jgi:hypothetical protein
VVRRATHDAVPRLLPPTSGATALMLGLLGERFLLVVPSLALPGSVAAVGVLVGALVAAGVLGIFLLAVGSRLGASGFAAERGRGA